MTRKLHGEVAKLRDVQGMEVGARKKGAEAARLEERAGICVIDSAYRYPEVTHTK